MLKRILFLALLSFVLPAAVFATEVGENQQINNGQDITRPLSRIDARYQYQLLKEGRSKNIFTLRSDYPIVMNDFWGIGLRVDLPSDLTNKVTADEPDGALRFGLGDVLGQILLAGKFNDQWAAAAGTQFVFPTAGTDQMGDGKYQIVPTVGVRRSLPGLSNGSFAAFLLRYAVDYAGSKKRQGISTLEMAPMFNWMLPRNWFVTAFPSTDIQVNFEKGGNFFLPFNAAIGKTIPKKAVFSVEFGFPMFYSGNSAYFYTFYEYKMEARVGFFY
jgi:hypothetical protein